MIEAVVFDMDGVLVDSEPVWERVRRAFTAAHGGRWAPDAQDRMMGMSTAEWSAYMSSDFGIPLPPAEIAEQVVAAMTREYQVHLPLLPGAVDAVRALSARWPLAVASSAPKSLIEAVLDASGMRPAFAAAVSSEEVPRGKPAPDVYLEAAARLGAPAASCAAIEDSSNGLRSAAAAGCTVIAIPRPEYPPAGDALALARIALHSLTDLTQDTITALLRCASECCAFVAIDARVTDEATPRDTRSGLGCPTAKTFLALGAPSPIEVALGAPRPKQTGHGCPKARMSRAKLPRGRSRWPQAAR